MNTIENKIKFFSLYSGQEIITAEKRVYSETPFDWHRHLYGYGFETKCAYANLKPLSSITDEDAKKVLHLSGYDSDGVPFDYELCDSDWVLKNALDNDEDILSNVADYLRSKGYALPWNGITVDEMQKMGWIKLIS